MARREPQTVPITAADMERFHRNAWAAIERRGGTYVVDEFGTGLRAVILGGVPLIGLVWWNWSALQLLLFYFVGSWVGIICDVAKLCLLERQIREWGETYYDDWHVWVVVDALRVGATHAAQAFLRAKYEPWSGVFVDFACGGISTILMSIGLIRSPGGIAWSELSDRTILVWLAGVSAYQILFTAWEIWEQGTNTSNPRKVKVAVGMRGLGLFLFMFLLVFVTDGFEETGTGLTRAMLAVNGAIILWGMGTMMGPLLIVRETRWSKEYLQRRDADARK
jgi:hypothetical protein